MKKIGISQAGKASNSQQGFTYVVVLVAIVILAIMTEAATPLVSSQIKAEKEREMIFRGQAYVKAIRSYYESGKTVKTFPQNIDDLTQDPRYPLRRHIRKLYSDPVSRDEWVLIRDEGRGIRGVVSSSSKKPLKISNFPIGLEEFNEASTYKDWRFVYVPQHKNNNLQTQLDNKR